MPKEPPRYEKPAVLEAFDASGHAVIEASAGTGKTHTLEHLVVSLVLESGLALDSILIVTFTEKATREMRERLRATLRRVMARADEHDAEVEPDAPHWVIDEAARERLEEALAIFDRAPISTIHAFCQRILTESAFDCARLLQQEAVESRDAFGRAFRDELRLSLAPGATLRPVVERVLARRGVGWLERTLYGWYVERGAPEPRFDPSRAEAALARLPTRIELAPGGFAAAALSRGLKRNPKKLIPKLLAEVAPIVERVRAGASLFDVLLPLWDWAATDAPSKMTALAYLRHHLGKSAAPSIAALAEHVETLGRCLSQPVGALVTELLPAITARLSGYKNTRGQLDFDDMLSLVRDALHAEGSGPLVAELRRRYRVALVDEFQDTDSVQWAIFRRLFFESAGDQRLFLIGDPKQAIYGFRNADVHTYHSARRAIAEAGGALVPLTVSYRSRAPLLRATHEILCEGYFTGVNEYPAELRCGRPELAARRGDGAETEPVVLMHAVGEEALRAADVRAGLARFVAAEASRLLDDGLRVSDADGERAIGPADIHVLCRSGADADAVGAALSAARVPNAFYKKEGLFQTPIARDLWVLLRAIEDPHHRGRRLDAWLTPWFAVPLGHLEASRDASPLHPLVTRLTEWRALAEAQRWSELLPSILEDSGFARRELFAARSERRLTDAIHILEVLLEETHRGHRSLPRLLARLSAFIEGRELPLGDAANVHRLESERDAVQILTMHKSKGLEAEVVFVLGGLTQPADAPLAPRVFHDEGGRRVAWLGDPPKDVTARLQRERREEAERLLYVAMTRARSVLYLPYVGPPPPDATEEREPKRYLLDPSPPEPEVSPQLSLAWSGDEPRAVADGAAEYELRRARGPYEVVNDRLRALVADAWTAGPLARRVVVPIRAEGSPLRPSSAIPAGWGPPVSVEPDAESHYASLRQDRAAAVVTSYTAMKRAARADQAPLAELTREASATDAVDAALPNERGEALPGGAAVGVFLHEVLEHLDFAAALEVDDAERWLDDTKRRALFESAARRNGVDEALTPLAAELLFRSLRAPLPLEDDLTLPDGLASVRDAHREVPFVHPIPEGERPATWAHGATDPRELTIERGYIRGVIDLVVQHESRYYVIDYKSDRLPSYEHARLRAQVERDYAVQARLYTLGTLRVLGITDEADYERRFGGLAYLFLRGMGVDGEGVWTTRPSWKEARAWEAELLEDAPFGYPLPRRRAPA